MKSIREATLKKEDAEARAKNYMNNNAAAEVLASGEADCCAYPTPDEIDQWSGTTNAYLVLDADYNELYACAYWE